MAISGKFVVCSWLYIRSDDLLVSEIFLVIAATANGFKQMAMLTSSATRNAIYRSFARKSDNIGALLLKEKHKSL